MSRTGPFVAAILSMARNRAFGPAEAGTTNGVSPGSRPFVVPPSGGKGHAENCCSAGRLGKPPSPGPAARLRLRRARAEPLRLGGVERTRSRVRRVVAGFVAHAGSESRAAPGGWNGADALSRPVCCRWVRGTGRLGKPSRSGWVEWSGRALASGLLSLDSWHGPARVAEPLRVGASRTSVPAPKMLFGHHGAGQASDPAPKMLFGHHIAG